MAPTTITSTRRLRKFTVDRWWAAVSSGIIARSQAEREKRAKVIHAEGEFTASQQLANAAAVIGSQPATLQLRYLQTLTEIAAEKNSTIIFPLPLELLQGFLQVQLPPPAPKDLNGNVPHVPGSV